MPYEASSPQFFKGNTQRFIYYEDIEKQKATLKSIAIRLFQFIAFQCPNLKTHNDYHALSKAHHSLDVEWPSLDEDRKKDALQSFDKKITSLQAILTSELEPLSPLLLEPIKTEAIILNIKHLFQSCLNTFAYLSEDNPDKIAVKEAIIFLSETQTFPPTLHKHLQTLLLGIQSRIKSYAVAKKGIEKHIHQYNEHISVLKSLQANVRKERVEHLRIKECRWHDLKLQKIRCLVSDYIRYMKSDKKAENSWRDEDTQINLAGYKTWQVVKERIRVLELLSTQLETQDRFTLSEIESIEDTIQMLVENEVSDKSRVLMTEKAFFSRLKRDLVEFKLDLIDKIKYLVKDYIDYIRYPLAYESGFPLDILPLDEDIAMNLRSYTHWQVVKNRLCILKKLQRLFHTQTSLEDLVAYLKVTVKDLITNGFEDKERILPIEQFYLTELEAYTTVNESQLLLKLKSVIEDYIKLIKQPSIFAEANDESTRRNIQHYSHWEIVQERLEILIKLQKKLSPSKLREACILNALEEAITDLERKDIYHSDYVLDEELKYFLELKKHYLRLKGPLLEVDISNESADFSSFFTM